MFLNQLHRTLYVNNRTVLNRLFVNSVNEAKQISISQKCYATVETWPDYQETRNFDKIPPERLNTFMKLRDMFMKSAKYDTSSSSTLNIEEFFNPQVIRSIKQMDWSLLTTAESLKHFKLLSVGALKKGEQIRYKDYKEIFSILSSNCSKFNDNELHALLRCLELWPNISKVSLIYYVRQLLHQIDIQLEKRSQHWRTEKTLMFCDTICKIFHFRSEYVSKSLHRLTSDPSTLTAANIVQIMYYLFIYSLPKSRIRKLEPYIEDYFDQLTIEEMAIICSGFFGSQVHITSDTILQKLMQKIIDNVNSISDFTLATFLKAIRYSFISSFRCMNTCEKLLEATIRRVSYMSFAGLTHLAHLMADSQVYNQDLMTAIMERFSENTENARMKDIERMIFLMTTFNYPPSEPLYNLIIKELGSAHRKEERRRFPKQFVFSLRHLAVANIYPLDLISYAMSREHMNLAYGPNIYDLGVEYLILDQSIRIEAPYYKGPRLEEGVCNVLAMKYSVEEEHSFGSKTKRQIVHILNNSLNCQEAASLEKIIPHFTQSDIVLCLDEDNNVIPPMPILKNIKSNIKRVPKEFSENRKWIAIIFASETLLVRKTNQFNGNLCAKIRQLKKVGYIPKVITYVEWKTLNDDFIKWNYLKKNILKISETQGKQNFASKAQ